MNINDVNFKKLAGLVPAVIQDSVTQAVLMVGFMNEEAVKRSIAEGKVVFWSRTKNRLWQKGEESGNFLNVVNMQLDCDNDTILVQAKPAGATCHTGEYSCFDEQTDFTLATLEHLITNRKDKRPKASYTSTLFDEGLDKICAKVDEEAEEVTRAAKTETKQRLIEESSDLVYHLLVLLAQKEIAFNDVVSELRDRNRGSLSKSKK